MAKTREIKKRIRTIESTRKITRTMELVATSKLKRAQDRVLASRPYSTKIREVLAALCAARQGGGADHPLLRVPEAVRGVEILALTSNRGLCGAYNANVIACAHREFRKHRQAGRRVRLHVSGKKGIGFFRFHGIPLASESTEPSAHPSFAHAESIGGEFLRAFSGDEEAGRAPSADRIVLVYTRFASAGMLKPVAETLLPLAAGEIAGGAGRAAGGGGDVLFEPGPGQIFETLLPLFVKIRVYEALLNAQASEQSARMIAMKMATDNAGELITSLTRLFNRQRQAQITQELAEIMGGVEALK